MHTSSPRALVTGASRGIGRAIALALAERHFHLALVARNEELLNEVRGSCERAGGKAEVIVADLGELAAPQRVAQEALRLLGGLDVLVNNAGVVYYETIVRADPAVWDHLMMVNIRAVAHVTHYVVPALEQSTAGAIINIASMAGKHAMVGGAAYCSSKHAVVGFSHSVFEDVRNAGIKVCVICPGFVKTDMLNNSPLDVEKAVLPEDIARAVLFVLDSGKNACPVEIQIRTQQTM